ncbi:MAG: Myxococcus phage Mx8, partial [Pseudomonadota bacterium]
MAFANSSISDLIATGIDSRTGEIANNVEGHNPILASLKAKGRVKTCSGGVSILEELSFQANPNGGAYDAYDPLPMAPADVISAAQYDWKQYAVPVVVSGKEEMQNSGKEALIDLVESRISVAEDTMSNLIETG